MFAEEILQEKISMNIVTERIKEHELLAALTSKRVYDRVRTTMKCSRPGELNLPRTSERMEDRVTCLTNSLDPNRDEVIPPSTSSKRTNAVFSYPKSLKMVRDGFREVIFHPPPPPFCKIGYRHPRELKLSGLIAYIMFYKICIFESPTITNDVIMTSLPKTMAKFGHPRNQTKYISFERY